MRVTLFDHNGSDRHVGAYFWTSTDKDSDAFECDESEIDRVIRFGLKAQPVPHGSPFGHSRVTVHVEDVPLPIAEQWLRHRVQNFSKKSYRYVAASPQFYIPEVVDLRRQVGRPGHYVYEAMDVADALDCIEIMREAYNDAWGHYERLKDRGLADEQARYVLSSGLLTKMYASGDLRNWLNFLVQRNDSHAQAEIRQCAEMVEAILDGLYPITMRLWREYGRRIV